MQSTTGLVTWVRRWPPSLEEKKKKNTQVMSLPVRASPISTALLHDGIELHVGTLDGLDIRAVKFQGCNPVS